MKKVLVVLFVVGSVLTFISCNKDDDEKTDPIVGKWSYYQEFENGIEYQLDECELKNTLEFKTNGTFTSIYYDDSLGNGCIMDDSEIGEWKNVGNSNYNFTFDVDDTETIKITFEGDTFSIEEDDGEDTYKTVFKRVN